MIIFFAILGLVGVAFIHVLRQEMTSPVFIFSGLWGIVLFLYSLQLHSIFSISSKTEMILCVGLLSFLMGTAILKHIRITPKEQLLNNEISYKKMTIIFSVIFTLSLGFYIPNIIKVLQGTPINAIKMMLVTEEIDLGGVVMQYIVRPFTYIIVAVATYCMYYKKKKKFLIILGWAFVLMEFLGAGSKTIVLYVAICLLFPMIMKKNEERSLLQKKIIIVVLIAFLFLFMGSSSVYFYICGCVPMLDKVINTSFYMSDGFSYGFVSFNSVIRIFIKILSLIGIELNSQLFEKANYYISRFEYTTQVSSNGNFNAFHTFLGDFYLDFGVVGVIVLSVMFGMLCMYIYRLYKESNMSLLGHVLYCIMLFYLIFSIVRFQMSNTFLGLMFIYSMTILKYILYPTKLKIGKIKL